MEEGPCVRSRRVRVGVIFYVFYALIASFLAAAMGTVVSFQVTKHRQNLLQQQPAAGDLWRLRGWGVVQIIDVYDHPTEGAEVQHVAFQVEGSPRWHWIGHAAFQVHADPTPYIETRHTHPFRRRIERQRRRHGR